MLIGTALCGEGNLGSISLLIATIVPVQNVLSVILLELCREGGRLSAKKVFGGVIKTRMSSRRSSLCLPHFSLC